MSIGDLHLTTGAIRTWKGLENHFGFWELMGCAEALSWISPLRYQ